MALVKEMTAANGIVTSYHRVVSVTTVTHEQSIIEVGSYISADERQRERDGLEAARAAIEAGGDEAQEVAYPDVWVSTSHYAIDYDAATGVDAAYAALKAMDEWEGAEDA